MSIPILSAKLNIPPTHSYLVLSARLIVRLLEAASKDLILIPASIDFL